MVVGGSVVFNPVGWWARFAPQLWLVPVLMVAYCVDGASRLGPWLGVALLTVILANGLLVGVSYWCNQYAWNHIDTQQLADIARASDATRVKAYLSNDYAVPLRFPARGIRYEAVRTPPTCPVPIALLQSQVVVCP
jgi:hypothetical protein